MEEKSGKYQNYLIESLRDQKEAVAYLQAALEENDSQLFRAAIENLMLAYDVGLTVREIVKEAYETAKEKGWHETERPPLEYHAMIHSEISEATEEARKGYGLEVYQPDEERPSLLHEPGSPKWKDASKPEGELIELADAVIRIADYCGSRGWDLEEAIKLKMKYNRTRSKRHGGKKY